MDAMENPVLEPRAERIARYKAERRRELAERYGITDELPLKERRGTRKDGREVQDTRSHNHRGLVNSESAPSISDRLHSSSRSRGVYNGVEAEDNHKRALDEVEEEDSKGDVKTDDRAKMSVAAKMSLFKELEKSGPASSFLKPRSGSVSHERRARRTNDHRFLTQPITCEEMVAISAPKHTLEPESESADTEPVEDDESCKMSMSEKLALFNKLSLPEKMTGGHVEGPPEKRRQKGARYRTQPITVEEVNLLQKGPVQLPAFSLDPHLSDRQQALSINLKPSELRLSQQRLDPSAPSFSSTQNQPQHDNEPALKGILKKSRSGGSDWTRTTDTPYVSEQNGGDREAIKEESSEVNAVQHKGSCEALNVERAPVTRAPWRQRARGRRETIACTPTPTAPEQEVTPNDRSTQSPLQRNGHDKDGHPTIQEEASSKRHNQTPLFVDNTPLKLNGRSTKEDSDTHHTDHSDTPQSWTNQSFEAQEVASPTKDPVQPLWRQKGGEDEPSVAEAEEVDACEQKKSEVSPELGQREADTEAAVHKETVPSEEKREDVPAASSDGGFHSDDQTPSLPCTPRRDASATDTEQDIFCQTNTPILTSAVAQHRRSVRPSRRTQGSRNPLRALAAREDIQQDFMGEAAEERLQALQKSKNCSSGHSQACPSEDASSKSSCTTLSPEPYKNLMLILIKGRRHVQVRLVEPSVRSLNSGDCFLLVTPEHCIVWSGEFANEQEKAKAHDLAFIIQSQRDLGCEAAEVVHLEEGLNSDSSQASDFWSHLGGRTQYRGASAQEEDEQFERGVVESNCAYRLVEDRLVPHEDAWACIPSSSLLDSNEALVFDFGSEVYLWCGQEVSQSSRSVAQQLARQVWTGPYDYSNCRVNPLDPTQCNPSVQQRGEGRPSWALFSSVSQNNETSLFREKFLDWSQRTGEKTVSAPVIKETWPAPPSSDPLSPCDAKVLVSGHLVEDEVHSVLSGVDVQRGHGVITLDQGRQLELRTLWVETWHVQEFDDSEVPVESTGQLHEGDSYVIRWTYTFNSPDKANGLTDQKENTAFFLWRGRHSSVTGRDTAAFLSIGMNNQEASQVVVPQGKEPPCFLQLFKGGLVIHRGTREEATSKPADWRLFVVRGELPEEGSLLEVVCSCAGLRSRGCVVLLNSQKGALFLWTGCKTQACTREVGKRTVERLTQMCPPELGVDSGNPLKVQTVEEGSEPAEFWAALGHMDRKAYDCMLQDPGKYNFTPRLFHLSASSGSFRAEEMQSPTRLPGLVMAMPFVQETLYAVPQPALFLLDNRLEVYLWQRGQPEETDTAAWSRWHNERRCAMQTAVQYCKEMNPRRPPQAYLIYEGAEPLTFTNVFPTWDRSLGSQTQVDVARVKLTLVQDALAQLMKTQYPLEELLQSPLPEGVDPQHLEVYLSDQDFQTILEMKRDEYASLPSWKQIDLKKSKGLLS